MVIVGASGCGKTTLLRGLAGLLPPVRGRFLGNSTPVAHLTAPGPGAPGRRPAALAVGPAQRGAAGDPRPAPPRAGCQGRALARPGSAWPGRSPGSARAVRRHAPAGPARQDSGRWPGAILMDEPFGALDAQTRATMQRLLIEVLNASPTAVVFVTHDVDEALFLGDRVRGTGHRTASPRCSPSRTSATPKPVPHPRWPRPGPGIPWPSSAPVRRPVRSKPRSSPGPTTQTTASPWPRPQNRVSQMEMPPLSERQELTCDVAVVGGGAAGPRGRDTHQPPSTAHPLLLLEKAERAPLRGPGHGHGQA